MKISSSLLRRFVASVRTLDTITKHVSNAQLQMSRGTNQYFPCPSTYKNRYLLRGKSQTEGKTLVMGGKKSTLRNTASVSGRQTYEMRGERVTHTHTHTHTHTIYHAAVKYVTHSNMCQRCSGTFAYGKCSYGAGGSHYVWQDGAVVRHRVWVWVCLNGEEAPTSIVRGSKAELQNTRCKCVLHRCHTPGKTI
jgi:hypothetical protein